MGFLSLHVCNDSQLEDIFVVVEQLADGKRPDFAGSQKPK